MDGKIGKKKMIRKYSRMIVVIDLSSLELESYALVLLTNRAGSVNEVDQGTMSSSWSASHVQLAGMGPNSSELTKLLARTGDDRYRAMNSRNERSVIMYM